jgi:hypothetical protein
VNLEFLFIRSSIMRSVDGASLACTWVGSPSQAVRTNCCTAQDVSAVFIFLRSRLTSLSPVIRFAIDLSFRGVLKCSTHPAKTLARVLCERAGGSMAAKWSPFFSSLSPLRRACGQRRLADR